MPPSPARLCLLPPDLALCISPARIRSLRRRRYPGLDAFDETNPLAIARALCFRDLPERTADLFNSATYLATDDGREAIFEAARARRDIAPWLGLTVVDLAIELTRAADAGDPVARAVQLRARTRMGRFLATRPEYELLLKRRERPADVESIARAGKAVHGDAHVASWVASGKDGVVRAVTVFEGLPAAIVTRARGAAERRSRRPLGCDSVRWDAERGRVGFSLARPATLPAWIETIGRECAGDPDLLERRPSSTLKGPYAEGGAWFKTRLPRGASHAEIPACEIDDGVRFGVRGDDAVGAMHARVGTGGYMYRSTIRYVTPHGSADATVELPNKLIIADVRFDALVREGMDVAELTLPGKIPDDLPSLAPWDQPEWRWVVVITREAFDWALSARILVPSRSRRPSDESFRAHGSMFTAHEIDGEEGVYCCPVDFSVRARDEPASVMKRWKLDVRALPATLRPKMDLAEARRDRVGDMPDGVIAIGELTTKAGAIVFCLVLRAVRKEDAAPFARKLRGACLKGQQIVAIVAEGRTLEGAVAEVAVANAEMVGFGDLAPLVARGAEALKLGDDIEPWRWGTRDAPLVLVVLTGEIWLGKARLDVTDNQRAMLFILAKNEGAYVAPPALGKKISAHAAHPDQVVRKAMLDLSERVTRSAREQDVKLEKEWVERLVVEKRGKGYRLGVGAILR